MFAKLLKRNRKMLNPQLLKKIEDKIATRARRIKIGYFSVQCQQKH